MLLYVMCWTQKQMSQNWLEMMNAYVYLAIVGSYSTVIGSDSLNAAFNIYRYQ